MHCYVYKGARRDDHYLYVLEKLEAAIVEQGLEVSEDLVNDLRVNSLTSDLEPVKSCKPLKSPERVPAALLEMLGELSFVVDFKLTEERKLPQADADQVLEILADQGFYLQMPKKDMIAQENQLFS